LKIELKIAVNKFLSFIIKLNKAESLPFGSELLPVRSELADLENLMIEFKHDCSQPF
jgi:hypothetical protein